MVSKTRAKSNRERKAKASAEKTKLKELMIDKTSEGSDVQESVRRSGESHPRGSVPAGEGSQEPITRAPSENVDSPPPKTAASDPLPLTLGLPRSSFTTTLVLYFDSY